ncbi:MAG: hypothetical protein JST19_04305 [Bacteroidetes bacterium]|nr:hypothetical protein [Bacteroidota bacterium]
MDQITSDQLNALSLQFLAMGNALLDFRANNPGIDPTEDNALEQTINELLDKAGQLATMSAIASGQEAASAVASLSQVKDQITQTIQHLAGVQKAIDIAAAALKVVVAVISMKPGDIVNSAGGLATTCGIHL